MFNTKQYEHYVHTLQHYSNIAEQLIFHTKTSITSLQETLTKSKQWYRVAYWQLANWLQEQKKKIQLYFNSIYNLLKRYKKRILQICDVLHSAFHHQQQYKLDMKKVYLESILEFYDERTSYQRQILPSKIHEIKVELHSIMNALDGTSKYSPSTKWNFLKSSLNYLIKQTNGNYQQQHLFTNTNFHFPNVDSPTDATLPKQPTLLSSDLNVPPFEISNTTPQIGVPDMTLLETENK
jgi:hypothetical protein